MQIVARQAVGRANLARPLSEAFPHQVTGWDVFDRPLGSTERLAASAQAMLRPDDFIYRTYRAPGKELGVYVSFWRARQMPVGLVAQHTPDVCWPSQGWVAVQARHDVEVSVGRVNLGHAEFRVFAKPAGAGEVQTYFWHFADGKVAAATSDQTPTEFWRDIWTRRFEGSPRQLFVRLTLEGSIAEIEREPVWRQLLEHLAELLKTSSL